MFQHLKRASLIATLSAVVILTSCKKKNGQADGNGPGKAGAQSAQSDNSSSQAPAAPILSQPEIDQLSSEAFRNLFFQLGQTRYTAEELRKLVFLPSPSLLNVKPSGDSALESIQSLSRQFEVFKPSDLHAYGKSVPSKPYEVKAASSPITLVIVPGIFSEFIDTFAFHEVVTRKDSSFAVKFAKSLESSSNAGLKNDVSFDFDTQADKEYPLSTFIRAGSIDDKNGQPIVQVMTLVSPMFSGESLGRLEDNAETYIRRIHKAFELMGTPNQIVLVGYSRGAAVALEMISTIETRKDKLPWASNIKGLLSVGGVIYGAAIADAAFDPNDPLNGLLSRLQRLANELELVPAEASTSDTLAAATRNTGRWVLASAELARMALKLPKADGLALENISSDLPHFDTNIHFLKTIAFEKFDFSDPSFKNYFLNIRKFKWIFGKAIDGITSLTTASRIKWWQEHTIPVHIKYLAIAGTMGDVSSKEAGVWAETGNQAAFAVRALDYFALRMNYYDLFRVSKIQVTDSQVSLERARFLPELNLKLNPKQATIQASYLGVLGVDHWGMIFPYATMTKNKIHSPFPRDLLAEALGIYLQDAVK